MEQFVAWLSALNELISSITITLTPLPVLTMTHEAPMQQQIILTPHSSNSETETTRKESDPTVSPVAPLSTSVELPGSGLAVTVSRSSTPSLSPRQSPPAVLPVRKHLFPSRSPSPPSNSVSTAPTGPGAGTTQRDLSHLPIADQQEVNISHSTSTRTHIQHTFAWFEKKSFCVVQMTGLRRALDQAQRTNQQYLSILEESSSRQVQKRYSVSCQCTFSCALITDH